VLQCSDRSGLAVEAFAELRVHRELRGKDFNRNDAIEPRVARFVDFAHPSSA
jgi:hypothetical protein